MAQICIPARAVVVLVVSVARLTQVQDLAEQEWQQVLLVHR
jgi:hypothetical protein